MLPPMLKANSENEEPSGVEVNVEVGSWTRRFTPGWYTLAFVGVGHAVVPILLTLCHSGIQVVASNGAGT
jgi:hypothetical protein